MVRDEIKKILGIFLCMSSSLLHNVCTIEWFIPKVHYNIVFLRLYA